MSSDFFHDCHNVTGNVVSRVPSQVAVNFKGSKKVPMVMEIITSVAKTEIFINILMELSHAANFQHHRS